MHMALTPGLDLDLDLDLDLAAWTLGLVATCTGTCKAPASLPSYIHALHQPLVFFYLCLNLLQVTYLPTCLPRIECTYLASTPSALPRPELSLSLSLFPTPGKNNIFLLRPSRPTAFDYEIQPVSSSRSLFGKRHSLSSLSVVQIPLTHSSCLTDCHLTLFQLCIIVACHSLSLVKAARKPLGSSFRLH
ncbi:hypothetical protein CGRA01v4_06639 [Colletotrichum graminicola]|nr:hypothetical protein CGRA01v4_06639 [Colletotrichum graminicola]